MRDIPTIDLLIYAGFDTDHAQNILKEYYKEHLNERQKKIDVIIQQVCNYYNTDFESVIARSRKIKVAIKRQVLTYLLNKYVGFNYAEFTKMMKRHRRSYYLYLENVENFIKYDEAFAEMIKKIEKQINKNFKLKTNETA